MRALHFLAVVPAPPQAAPGGGKESPLRWLGQGSWKLELGAGLVSSATGPVLPGQSELGATWV